MRLCVLSWKYHEALLLAAVSFGPNRRTFAALSQVHRTDAQSLPITPANVRMTSCRHSQMIFRIEGNAPTVKAVRARWVGARQEHEWSRASMQAAAGASERDESPLKFGVRQKLLDKAAQCGRCSLGAALRPTCPPFCHDSLDFVERSLEQCDSQTFADPNDLYRDL